MFSNNVGNILAKFEKLAEKLDVAVEKNRAVIGTNVRIILDTQAVNAELLEDNKRAERAATKLRELIS